MEQSKLFTVLKETGLPVTYREWPVNKAPSLPYILFIQDDIATFESDNSVYHHDKGFSIEIYSDKKNPALEDGVIDVLNRNEIIWSYGGETRTDEGIYIAYLEV